MSRLRIQNITKSYGPGAPALADVSLTIANGLFGLLGPNGAGKSTLMRTLATMQPPDSGQIFFDGHDILAQPQHLRSGLGYLPQDFGVYPKVSALELLDYLAVLKGVLNKQARREQVLALLQQTNLYAVRKQAVSTFSGGMRQRFGIAQALLGNPQLLIVDEPTAGLDPQERNRFHDLLSELGEQVVVVLSTHIVEDVHDLCPAMAVLAGGRVILQGKPADLMGQLGGQVWRKIIPKETLPAYQAAFQVISTRLIGGQLALHVRSTQRPDSGFELVAPGLEEVYFSALFGAQRPGKEEVTC